MLSSAFVLLFLMGQNVPLKPKYISNCEFVYQHTPNVYLSAIHLQSEQTPEFACKVWMPIGRL